MDAVSIPKQEPWGLVPRKGLKDLRCNPLGGGIPGDIEMYNAPAIVRQDEEHVQDPEGGWWGPQRNPRKPNV